MISIGSIVQNFKNSNSILTSPKFKSLESLINSEELPIVMFLTTLRDEIEIQGAGKKSKLIQDEIDNLFQIMVNEEKLNWVFDTHVGNVVKRRYNGYNAKNILGYALKIMFSKNLDQFFQINIDGNANFEENACFLDLVKAGENELIERIRACGVVV